MERPSIRQLEYLVAVDKHLYFREAAESCHVTQPALSTQLQQLEALLGVQLFARDTRRVVATAAGIELAERARRILGEVDGLLDRARAEGEPLTGRLRVGAIPTVAPYILPAVVRAVREAHPDLKLLLTEDQTDRIVAQLHAGELDMLLLALDVDLKGAEEQQLFDTLDLDRAYTRDDDGTLTLTLRQEVPPTPGQPRKEPQVFVARATHLPERRCGGGIKCVQVAESFICMSIAYCN